MPEEPRQSAIHSALHRHTRGAPLSSFAELVPHTKPASGWLDAELDDGTAIMFERRTEALHGTGVYRLGEDGFRQLLEDGVYRLTSNIAFQVIGGVVDFGLILAGPGIVAADPNAPPMNPHPPYQAWKEVVAIMDDLLFAVVNPAEITDVIRFVAPDGVNYYAVQSGLEKPYKAYVVADGRLEPLRDGEYSLGASRGFQIDDGGVHPDFLNDLKVFAYESTRLPL